MDARQERFARLYARHCDDVLRYAVRRVAADAAWDVVEETFLVAWRRLEELREPDELLWLYATARRVIAQEMRSRYRRTRLYERIQATAGGEAWLRDHADEVTSRMQLMAALETLPPHAREALMLVGWEGLDTASAAQVAGCSVTAFRVRLHRARRRLAEALDDDGPVETPLRTLDPSALGSGKDTP